jgi:hypothetical protein
MLWGNRAWAVEGVESPEPPDRDADPDRSFVAAIRRKRLGEKATLPGLIGIDTLARGDSNFLLSDQTEPRRMTVTVGDRRIETTIALVANDEGRLGGAIVEVPKAKSPRTAYQVARTAFNGLQMQLAFEQDLSINEAAIAVWEVNGNTFVMCASVGFPDLLLNLESKMPSAIMQRLIAPYADALNSDSPYYSFLICFALIEFMLNSWIGAIREAYKKHGLIFPARSYIADFNELDEIAPWCKGKPYKDILTEVRHLRNLAGGSHFNFAIGPRVLTVKADDQIACCRDVFRLILKAMLINAREDVEILIATGVDEATLGTELQRFFDRHDGLKKAAQKKRKRPPLSHADPRRAGRPQDDI